MNPLFIKQTSNTPEINFDPQKNIFEIKGESRPENVFNFFNPLILWIDEYFASLVQSTKEGIQVSITMQINIQLGYFNSSSAKYIFDILQKFQEFETLGAILKALWLYDEEDENMKQAGIDLSEMLEFPFSFESVII